jgi:uncharacterized membrane protein YdjX (TVP38/TMEM64 family)
MQMKLPEPGPGKLRLRLAGLLLALLVLLALAALWAWSPLKHWLDIERIVHALQGLASGYGPLAAAFAFALALACAVPLTFLILVAIVAFGPWGGLACALAGALAGAAISYGIGRWLGHAVLLRLGGARINALSLQLARRALLAIVVVRLTPVAPFAVVNMVAGASHIRLRDLLLGTAIGMMPSTVFMMLFVDRISAALAEPSLFALLLIALTLVLLLLGGWGVRRMLARAAASAPGGP